MKASGKMASLKVSGALKSRTVVIPHMRMLIKNFGFKSFSLSKTGRLVFSLLK